MNNSAKHLTYMIQREKEWLNLPPKTQARNLSSRMNEVVEDMCKLRKLQRAGRV